MKCVLISICLLFLSTTLYGQRIFQGDTVKFLDGNKVILCNGDNVEVAVLFSENIEKNHTFWITISNSTSYDINFDPSNIKVVYVKKGEKEEHEVFTYEQYLKRKKRQLFWFGPSNIEQVSHTQGQSKIKDEHGMEVASVESHVTTQVYTGAHDKAVSNVENKLRANYLKKTTIFANGTVSGMVVAKNPKVDNLVVRIPINNNMYVFNLSQE